MQKVLVTGAGGYIGIPLCQMLAQKGYSVTALDRCFFGRDRFAQAASHPNIKMLIEDIRTVDPQQFEGMDAVIDLAGLSNDASAEIDPELTVSINHQGGVRLARAAKRAGVRRYVYSSSASVYGHGQEVSLNEHAACRPQTLYAESKLHVEDELRKLQSGTFETVILRNSTVFGLAPRMRFDLAINVMTLRAWKERVIYVMGGGEQWRPFIHVHDVCRALIMGIESEASIVSGETFNVGGDDLNYQIKQLANFVKDIIPNIVTHTIPDATDKRTYNLSFAKITQRLKFDPSSRVHEGIVEIKQALERGTVSGDDPTTHTLGWYRSLIDWEKRIKELSINGKIL
ncbi:SDR family oxidoreductase [Bradyrhizobium sp. BR 10289]|uniref:NAD-dependent epimerase/dehydratase family protein n=1 Tax=Bradyrhizobium sp. BR 10289 TaxID=2749993 RepID=UPI001C64662C|nr:SDR family oxidoreductase [Bradyrhizobium sp. BR 10289]MBW7974679.1 SDR family oxidoreductase [Bradyrhizobium sp. BR 10289]